MKLEGKGTYITAIALLSWAVGGFFAGKVSLEVAIPEIIIAFGIIRGRMAIGRIKS